MFTDKAVYFLYAISPVHAGSGQGLGLVDNPIQREKHTSHPVIAGSGIKGALRHHVMKDWDEGDVTAIFGPSSGAGSDLHAGAISFADAQLVAFPLRSLKGGFVYATSAGALGRLSRMLGIAGKSFVDVGDPGEDRALVADEGLLSNDRLTLEDFQFSATRDEAVAQTGSRLAELVLPEREGFSWFRRKLSKHLVVLPEQALAEFCRSSTVIEPHVRIDDETGTASTGGLFYTENTPPETIFAGMVMASCERTGSKEPRSGGQVMARVVRGVEGGQGLDDSIVQVGGDATTGRGQVLLTVTGVGE